MLQAARELGACAGLDPPEEIIQLEPGWIEALIEQTTHWKDNIHTAPQWTTWRAASRAVCDAGLGPLAALMEDGSIEGKDLADTFEYAYARWVAETIVNADEMLSGFLARSDN